MGNEVPPERDERGRFSRRSLLKAVAGGVATGALPPASYSSASQDSGAPSSKARPQVWDISDQKQLFIDSRFLATSRNVTLTMNPAQKLGIVLPSGDVPWEVGSGGYFRVLDEGSEGREKCRLYYGSFTREGHGLAYAESEDGLHWVKPRLGVVSVEGNRDNNLIYPDNAIDAMVMSDPRDIPERRYKMLRSLWSRDKARDGVYVSCSADGIHFDKEEKRVFPMWNETGLIADWDPALKKYVIFTRVFVQNSENQRRIGRIVADDLLQPWPYRGSVSELGCPSPENIDQVLSVDTADDPFSDFYTGGAVRYPYAQDVYLMFPSPFRHFAPSPGRQPWFQFEPGNDYGLIETQMAVSRDGITWSRPDRRPYFPMGLPDEWDRWLTMMGVGMVRRGNYLYQYYWSSGRMHDSGILRPEYKEAIPYRSAYGALRQRLDGFMSADFAYGGGELTTPPLRFTGTHLRLNIDTGGMGTALIEIRDTQGRPLPGFALADCEEMGGNFIDTPVRWRGKADLTALQDKLPVSLHIRAKGAKLYAFQFCSGTVPA
jgi:hypothetical protein